MSQQNLSNDVLAVLPANVARPKYDRTKVTPGILHFGVGAFHRSHQALTIDRLLTKGLANDWGIIGVGLLANDIKMRDALIPQDCLYTLITKHADGNFEYQVIGSIIDYLFAPDLPAKVIEKICDPEIRIISLTITEGGYSFDRATGEFDPTTAGIASDLEDSTNPVSAFGFIYEGLKKRRALGISAPTIQSCDNIQGNGDVAKKMMVAFAELKDPEFATWMLENVAFPNAMVDRITPVTAPADIELASKAIGFEDKWPVPCESFFQWVIEDHFPMGRPPFEEAFVQMVEDVIPYELMKLRLLNASHQALCYFGRLSNYTYAHEALADPLIEKLLRRFMDEEATPTLSPVPGVDLALYKSQLIERFSNPKILDTVARLAAETSDRIPKWLIPIIRENLASAGQVKLSAAVVASWARYDEGVDELGNPINVVDPLKDELMAIAAKQKTNPMAFIENRKLFGDLASNPRFTEPYLMTLDSLHKVGAQETLADLLNY
jgi:mannitol 2-dehydrogenase